MKEETFFDSRFGGNFFYQHIAVVLNTWLVLLMLSNIGCREQLTSAAEEQSVNTVSGILHLFLHRRDAIGLYVRFELEEHVKHEAVIRIADSGIIRISEHPIPFSLPYPPDMVKQDMSYRLTVTVLEDPEGTVELISVSAPVLTQGHPSAVNLAIQPSPEPVE